MSGGQDVIRWGWACVKSFGAADRPIVAHTGIGSQWKSPMERIRRRDQRTEAKDGRNFKIPEREKLLDLTARMQVAAESM
jgi:hypothetical protein